MYDEKIIGKEKLLEKLWNDKLYLDENVLMVVLLCFLQTEFLALFYRSVADALLCQKREYGEEGQPSDV